MNKRVTIQFADFIKSRLAGGLLCCLVLLAAYLFQMFFPGMYVDAFSSSFYLFAWLPMNTINCFPNTVLMRAIAPYIVLFSTRLTSG